MKFQIPIYKMFRIIILIIITASIVPINVIAQLSGTYTLNPLGGDFASENFKSLGEAVDSLQSLGVDAPVTILIAAGIYDEQVSIPSITGAGPVNTVTFQSSTGNAENVEITFKATSGKPYTVLLEGADYVNFENLTITATDSTYSTALEMAGSCSNISIGNCIINSISNADNTGAIYSKDNLLENININGNTINDGLYGIFLDGENSGLSNNLTITGNTIQGHYAGGIVIRDNDVPSVTGNTITSDSLTDYYYAIHLSQCKNDYLITKNKITVHNKWGGINVNNSDGNNVNRGMISNNMINLTGEGGIQVTGIITNNSDYVNVYFNTVRIIGSNTNAMSNAYYNYGGSYVFVLNNIFCNFGSGRAYYTTNFTSIFSSDYNCLFTGGNLIAATGSSYFPTLTLFSQATSKDINSIVVNPAFLADSNLHANSWFLDGAGVLITGQDEDFDGEIRADPPDIGADEYTSTLYPLDNGTYTIGGISPHYNTIKEAMDDLQHRGVLAPTTFKIRTGDYIEYVGDLYKIPGSDADNPVVLTSETGNHENVTISYSTTNEERNIFNLKNVDYFTIRDLTISAGGDTDGRPIRVSGSIKDLSILNNHLSSPVSEWATLYIRGYTDSLFIAENTITQSEYGIFLQDNSPYGINSTNTRIIRNSIEGASSTGIWVQGQDSLKIIGNNIINQTYTSFEGIFLQSCHSETIITGNSIYCNVSSTGIEIDGCEFYPSYCLISNNMISIGGNYIARGIYLSETERINIYHNSVNITSSHQDYGIGIYLGYDNNEIELINNIISNTGTGYALVADDPDGIIASDFNNIFASGIGRFAKWGTDVADLSALQTVSSKDSNSLSLDPLFYSEADLHSKQGGLIENATPLEMVPYDIDSVLRDPEHPDIGAAEILCLLDMTVDNVSNISCYGKNDGTIDITVTGIAPPYSFDWSNGDTTEDVSGLAPGKFIVTISDTNKCSVSDSAEITEPVILTSNITDSTNISLPGGSDGQATVTPAGGTPNYSYLWDNESNSTESTATGLLANKYYHVTITDFNGCLTLDSVILSEPGILRVEIADSTLISCNGASDGTATATVWGGDPPYTIEWNDDDTTKTKLVTGLSPERWYRVVVTDLKGQIASDSIMLPEPETIIIIKDYSYKICYGENNGYIDIDVTGGTPPYVLHWETGEDTSVLEGLANGEYVLNITDANGCTMNDTTCIDTFIVHQGEEICMVTVSNTNRLLIVWEKTKGERIAYYNIYRRGITGGFDKIGTQPYESLSVFLDDASVPDEMSYEYKISAVDSCENESELSSLHKSIHLNTSRGDNVMNLVWNEYTGYEYFNYQIYRGSSYLDLHKYRMVPYTNLTYTDTDPPSGVLYYRIGASKLAPCFPSGTGKKSLNEDYELAMSNIDDNGLIDIQQQMSSEDLLIYPNPVNKAATLYFNNSEGKSYTLYLLDLSGKVCHLVNDITSSEYVIEKEGLNAGIYFIELRGEKMFRGKLMIE